MKKSVLKDIENILNFRIKDETAVEFYHRRLYVVIIPLDRAFFWIKTYTEKDIDGLEPQEIGRLVKEDYEKFIIQQHIYC